MNDYKFCSRCKQSLPRTAEFWHSNKRSSDGFNAYCRSCANAYSTEYRKTHPKHTSVWRKKNPQKARESALRYYDQNRETMLNKAHDRRSKNPEQIRERARQYYAENRERLKSLQKQYRQEKKSKLPIIPKKETPASPKYRPGYVYLLKSPTGYYKIGRAKNPEKRLETFNVKLPFEVDFECLIYSDDMWFLERELHIKFKDKRVQGEWFKLDDEDIAYIKSLVSENKQP